MTQLATRLAVAAADQRFEAGTHFDQRERLTEIIIRAKTQPFDALVKRIPRRQN